MPALQAADSLTCHAKALAPPIQFNCVLGIFFFSPLVFKTVSPYSVLPFQPSFSSIEYFFHSCLFTCIYEVHWLSLSEISLYPNRTVLSSRLQRVFVAVKCALKKVTSRFSLLGAVSQHFRLREQEPRPRGAGRAELLEAGERRAAEPVPAPSPAAPWGGSEQGCPTPEASVLLLSPGSD